MKGGDKVDRPDVYRIGSLKSIIVGLIFSIIFGYFVFGPLGQKVNNMINEPIVDGKFFINEEYIKSYFSKISESSETYFIYLHVVDSFFALSYALFLWALCVRLFFENLEFKSYLLVLPPLLAGLFDLVENILLIILTFMRDKISSELVLVTTYVIPAKFIFLLVSLVMILIGIVLNMIQRFKN